MRHARTWAPIRRLPSAKPSRWATRCSLKAARRQACYSLAAFGLSALSAQRRRSPSRETDHSCNDRIRNTGRHGERSRSGVILTHLYCRAGAQQLCCKSAGHGEKQDVHCNSPAFDRFWRDRELFTQNRFWTHFRGGPSADIGPTPPARLRSVESRVG